MKIELIYVYKIYVWQSSKGKIIFDQKNNDPILF